MGREGSGERALPALRPYCFQKYPCGELMGFVVDGKRRQGDQKHFLSYVQEILIFKNLLQPINAAHGSRHTPRAGTAEGRKQSRVVRGMRPRAGQRAGAAAAPAHSAPPPPEFLGRPLHSGHGNPRPWKRDQLGGSSGSVQHVLVKMSTREPLPSREGTLCTGGWFPCEWAPAARTPGAPGMISPFSMRK